MTTAPVETTLLPIYLPDLAEITQTTMVVQDQTKPRLQAYYASVGNMWQTIEDCGFDVVSGLLFETATATALDRWGQIVGQRRNGMGDNDYRRMIGAKILVNHCQGTPDEFAAIVRVIALTQRVWTATPAGGLCLICYQTYSMTAALRRALARAMDDIRLLGRQSVVLESTPTGIVLAGSAGGLVQVPAGYESRLDIGQLGRTI